MRQGFKGLQGSVLLVKARLIGMSEEDYQKLKNTGMLWEFYPDATGNYKQDCKENKDD